MKSSQNIPLASETNYLPTTDFAAKNLVKDQTVRKRYSQTGSYHGARPIKLASGRLAWPDTLVRN